MLGANQHIHLGEGVLSLAEACENVGKAVFFEVPVTLGCVYSGKITGNIAIGVGPLVDANAVQDVFP